MPNLALTSAMFVVPETTARARARAIAPKQTKDHPRLPSLLRLWARQVRHQGYGLPPCRARSGCRRNDQILGGQRLQQLPNERIHLSADPVRLA